MIGNIRVKRSIIFAALTLILTAALCVAVSAVTAISENAIVSAALQPNLTAYEVKCEFTDDFVSQHKGETVSLYLVPPYGSASKLAEYTPVAGQKCDSKITFKVSADLAADPTLVFGKLLVATEGANGIEIAAPARYFDNPELLAANKYSFPQPQSKGSPLKKGLRVSLWGDAMELGVSHALIDVPINALMAAEAGDTYSYEWAGSTWYVSRAELDRLDFKTRLMTDAGINVYFRFVLEREDGQSSALDCLYYESASDKATQFALNVGNEKAVLWAEGLCRYLCERYTDPARPHGFCGSYIWGYDVNSNRTYYSMGAQSMDSFLNYYIAAYRILDTAVRSVYSDARTYISLDNNYNVLVSDLTHEADSTLDYDALTFLGKFADKVRYSGDLPWRLAITASPSSRSNSRVWEDDRATGDSTTPFITMKNIDVLTLLMSGDQYLYNGQPRSILIDEFEVTGYSAGNGEINAGTITETSTGADTTSEQAASYAYAYYQAAFSDRVEALIYSKHFDTSDQRRGIWTSSADGDAGELIPVSRKPIYNVFKYIDTSRSEEMTASSLSVIGITSWADIVKKYNINNLAVRDITETIPQLTADLTKQLDSKVLFDFTKGNYNDFFWSYFASGPETTITLDDDADERGSTLLHATMTSRTPSEYMGIGVTKAADEKLYTKEELEAHSIPLTGVRYISFDIMVGAPEDAGKIAVMLWTGSSGSAGENAAVYEGVAQIDPGVWTNVTFKMDSLTDSHSGADSMRIMIRPYDEQQHDGAYSMYLKQVLIWVKPQSRVLTVLKVIGIILLVLLIIVVLLLVALIIRRQIIINKQKAERARRRTAQKQAAAMRGGASQAPPGQARRPAQQYPPQQYQPYNSSVNIPQVRQNVPNQYSEFNSYSEFNDAGYNNTGSTPAVSPASAESNGSTRTFDKVKK